MFKITVPASTSNFGSGFDAFGLALGLYNDFFVEFSEAYSVEVEGEGAHLPKDKNNLFIRAYVRACQLWGISERPLRLRQVNRVPTARGLGSSATAIAGGISAFEVLHNVKLSLEDKLRIAFEFEPHPDNLLPAFLGGFVVCAGSEEGVKFLRLDFPEGLNVVVCIPHFELSTQRAREVLKREVSLKDAVFNLQRSALFVGSLFAGRFDLLKEAVKDKLHQPYRSELIPGLWRVMEMAYSAGALAVFLSGAGPSVAGICLEGCREIGKAMVEAFKEKGVNSDFVVLTPSQEGVRVEASNP